MLMKLLNVRCVASLGLQWIAENMLPQWKSENSIYVCLILFSFLCSWVNTWRPFGFVTRMLTRLINFCVSFLSKCNLTDFYIAEYFQKIPLTDPIHCLARFSVIGWNHNDPGGGGGAPALYSRKCRCYGWRSCVLKQLFVFVWHAASITCSVLIYVVDIWCIWK